MSQGELVLMEAAAAAAMGATKPGSKLAAAVIQYQDGPDLRTVTMVPARGKLLVEPVEEEKTTRGGIIIPDVGMEKPQRAIIRAIGLQMVTHSGFLVPHLFEEGQEVWFNKYSGVENEIGGRKFMLLTMEDVLCSVSTKVERLAPAMAEVSSKEAS